MKTKGLGSNRKSRNQSAGRKAGALSYVDELNNQGISVSVRMREIVKLFGRQLSTDLRAYGITVGQWRFLRVLWERDGRSQKEIAEALEFTPGATVFALATLERDGLAVRQRAPEDNRISRVYLTPKSRALERQLMPYSYNSQLKALQGFSPAEIDTLLSLFDRIKNNLVQALDESREAEAESPGKKRRGSPAGPTKAP